MKLSTRAVGMRPHKSGMTPEIDGERDPRDQGIAERRRTAWRHCRIDHGQSIAAPPDDGGDGIADVRAFKGCLSVRPGACACASATNETALRWRSRVTPLN